MAENQADGGERMAIRLEYRFDRLLAEKLAQAYERLVPERRGLADHPDADCREVLNDQDGRHLRACFLRSAEGEPYYRQPSDGTDPVR